MTVLVIRVWGRKVAQKVWIVAQKVWIVAQKVWIVAQKVWMVAQNVLCGCVLNCCTNEKSPTTTSCRAGVDLNELVFF
jgi:hypothetical protein